MRGFVIRAVLQRLREFGAPAPVVRVEDREASTLSAAPSGPVSAGPIHLPANHSASSSPPANQPFASSVIAQPFRSFAALPPRSGGSTAPNFGSAGFQGSPSAPIQPANSGAVAPASSPTTRLGGWRFLEVVHGDYALFEAPGGMVVLDRRSAHERVWFEQLQAQFAKGEVTSQRLLFALPVELDAIASALLIDHLKFLQAHGLEVAEFGRNFFRIEAVPSWLLPEDAELFLRDVIGLMREGRLDLKKADLAHDELARLAAQKAVRLPARVNETDAMTLVTRLFACTQPHTSPSGRPTHFELSRGELARRFQR